MSAVYDSDLEDIYDVSVMLALANHADDSGVCYPSIARICKLSRCKPRKAQNVIKSLQDRGYLFIEIQAGPRGTNRYHLTPIPPHSVHPAQYAPPPHDTTPPPHEATFTPAQCAPETSRTINKPSLSSSGADAPDKKARLPSDWVPDEVMTEYALSKELTTDDIKEIADDFLAYWTDQPKSKSTKSLNGWRATWRNNINRIGWQYVRNRRMAGVSSHGGRGQGGGIAGAVARRRAAGEN